MPQIEYVKEQQPGPRHIAEVAEMVGDRVKCIMYGAQLRPTARRDHPYANSGYCAA